MYALAYSAGRVRCSALPLDRAVSLADRPYFQRAVSEGRSQVSNYFVDRLTGKGTLLMAIPNIGPFRQQVDSSTGYWFDVAM